MRGDHHAQPVLRTVAVNDSQAVPRERTFHDYESLLRLYIRLARCKGAFQHPVEIWLRGPCTEAGS